MGGPSGGSTGGGNGGVGPAGRTSSGSYGTAKDAKKVSKRNEFRTFIKDGGVTGAIIKGITGKTPYEANLERRQKFVKDKGLSSDDINMDASYLGSKEGLAELRKKGYTTAADNLGSGNDNSGATTNQTAKSIEQPKVKSQMDNSEVKSDLITAEAPALTEMTADEILLKNKRKGRKKTVLTSVSGVEDYPTLSKKTLLGG